MLSTGTLASAKKFFTKFLARSKQNGSLGSTFFIHQIIAGCFFFACFGTLSLFVGQLTPDEDQEAPYPRLENSPWLLSCICQKLSFFRDNNWRRNR